MRFHRYGHVENIKVKEGDLIKQGQLLALNGTGNGQWPAHCHYDILTYRPDKWTEYCIGQTKEWVEAHYADPRGNEKDIMPTFDHLGLAYLEYWDYDSQSKKTVGAKSPCFHPGLDLNGPGSGNADLNESIYSASDGKVVYVHSGTDSNAGWGDIVVVEETNFLEKKGIDISHWQGGINWSKVKTDFVIQKCSQGTAFIDATFLSNRQATREKGIHFGAYHFADGGDALAEAKHFVASVGEIREGEFLALDWEIEHFDPVGWCRTFMEEVKRLTGLMPLFYTNDARAVKYSWPKDWKFWIARYGINDGTMNRKPDFPNWSVWQYTSQGELEGITGRVDMNWTQDDLRLWGKIIINNQETMTEEHEKNYKKIAQAVAKKVNFDYGENPSDKETEELLEKFGKMPVEVEKVVEKPVIQQVEVIKEVEVVKEKIVYQGLEQLTVGELLGQIVKIIKSKLIN